MITTPLLSEIEEKILNIETDAVAFTQQKTESTILLNPQIWPREGVINGSPLDAE